MKKGIDISVWQHPDSINYDVLASQIDFAIIRLGFTGHNNGRNPRNFNKDRHFETHYRELKKRGVPVGAYYYGGAMNDVEVERELEIVREAVKGKQFEFPIYYDVEENLTHGKLSYNHLTNIVYKWCEKLESEGFFVGIYASLHWFNKKMDKKKLSRFSTWLAQWGVKKPSLVCGMWQYTDSGRLRGHSGNLDMNIAYDNFEETIKKRGLNGFDKKDKPKPKPKPTPVYDRVTVKKSATHFVTGERMSGWVKGYTFDVAERAKGKTLIANDGVLIGWVHNSDLLGVGQPKSFEVGDRIAYTTIYETAFGRNPSKPYFRGNVGGKELGVAYIAQIHKDESASAKYGLSREPKGDIIGWTKKKDIVKRL